MIAQLSVAHQHRRASHTQNGTQNVGIQVGGVQPYTLQYGGVSSNRCPVLRRNALNTKDDICAWSGKAKQFVTSFQDLIPKPHSKTPFRVYYKQHTTWWMAHNVRE